MSDDEIDESELSEDETIEEADNPVLTEYDEETGEWEIVDDELDLDTEINRVLHPD